MYIDQDGEAFILSSLLVGAIITAAYSAAYTVYHNWDDVKKWQGNSAKYTGKWFEKQWSSVKSWFNTNDRPKAVGIRAIENEPTPLNSDGFGSLHNYLNLPLHTDSFDGFWGKVNHVLTGGVENGGRYDWNGNYQGVAPIGGGGAIELIGGVKGAFALVSKISKAKNVAKEVGSISKNAKKMSPNDIGTFLGAGKDWHKTSEKSKFLNKFKKELKGDTNADFYIDKTTKEVFLKSNKSGNWINTGEKFQ